MPVIDTAIDRDARAVIITADFAASPAEVFAIYENPRSLERVWGPPTHPAAFVDHVLLPGFRSTYYLRGPQGIRYPGWWGILTVDRPWRFTFDDGFADGMFNALPGSPVAHNEYTFLQLGSRTRARYVSSYATLEDLDAVVRMGAVDDAVVAVEQLDIFLREELRQELRSAVRA